MRGRSSQAVWHLSHTCALFLNNWGQGMTVSHAWPAAALALKERPLFARQSCEQETQ